MIHQYENNGYQIILDVNSGAVHVVDPLCYELMEWLTAGKESYTAKELEAPELASAAAAALKEKYPESEIAEALEDLAELTRGRTAVHRGYHMSA